MKAAQSRAARICFECSDGLVLSVIAIMLGKGMTEDVKQMNKNL